MISQRKSELVEKIGEITKEMVNGLKPREAQCIRFRFGMGGGRPHSLSETADVMQLSRQRVAQIELKALEKMLGSLGAPKLKPDENSLSLSVDELALSPRAYHCFKTSNIRTVGDIVQLTEPELLKIRNFGAGSLREIQNILGQLGLSLAVSPYKYSKKGRLKMSDMFERIPVSPPVPRLQELQEDNHVSIERFQRLSSMVVSTLKRIEKGSFREQTEIDNYALSRLLPELRHLCTQYEQLINEPRSRFPAA